jgi:hypothetical protein
MRTYSNTQVFCKYRISGNVLLDEAQYHHGTKENPIARGTST